MDDKRGRQPEIPFGYEKLLTEEQIHAIEHSEKFGWSLHFIRRPLFQEPTVVLHEPHEKKWWQVLSDGKLVPFTEIRDA